MIISLMGFMGSGKSTFGRGLANHLGLNFVDLDDFIEEKKKMTVNEIFDRYGEDEFRKLETTCLNEIIDSFDNAILSLGGGTPCCEGNWESLQKTKSIYLKRTPLFLFKILKSKRAQRPLIKDLNDNKLKELIVHKLETRATFYNRADLIFHGYGSKKALLNRLIQKIENWGGYTS